MTPGCTIIGLVRAKPGKRDELLSILAGFVAPTRAEPGCLDYHLHSTDNDPDLFMFYENFATYQDLQDHLQMPYLSVLKERAEELLGAEVEIRHYTMHSDYDR